jgi:concentrative nucleoside transporter, CNT family
LYREKATTTSFQARLKGLLLFLFLFTFLSTGFSIDKIKSSNLIKYWVTQSINGEKTTNDSTVSNALILLKKGQNQYFEWIQDNESIKGEWSLAIDTLTLVLDYQPTLDFIDSTAYVVEDGQPNVRFYKGGKLISTLTDDGLKSTHIIRTFIIKKVDDEELKLFEPANQLNYFFKPKNVKLAGHITFNDIARGILGMMVLLLITYLLSSNKKAIDWRLVGTGILIQILFAVLVLKVGIVREVFSFIAGFFVLVMDFTYQGSSFLFGSLMDVNTYGFIFAFQVLPTIIFFSALSSILYYLGILQKIVYGLAWVMSKTMRLSGAESLAAAANIFIGQTEAPLVVKPYLENMSKSEILCLMVGGMATIAGGVFAAYVGFLGGNDPEQMQFFATHLLTASIMSAPAAIVAAKILYPEVNPDQVDRTINIPKEKIGSNFLDAISNGTTDGLKLAVNVGVMLLTFTALIYMVNHILLWFGDLAHINQVISDSTKGQFSGLSLDYILGLMFYPIAWVLGVPSHDALLVAQLLGKKTVVNEFIAYQSMEELKEAGMFLSNKSIIISTYALCGFANFASIGIQIGGIGAIAPGQRKTLAAFGIKALIGGTIAAFLTAVIAGTIV